jgi:uncharacterized membrane-anchored protein
MSTYNTFDNVHQIRDKLDEDLNEQVMLHVRCRRFLTCNSGIGLLLSILTAITQIWMMYVACDTIYQVNAGIISAPPHYYAYVLFVISGSIQLCILPVIVCVYCGCICCALCLGTYNDN